MSENNADQNNGEIVNEPSPLKEQPNAQQNASGGQELNRFSGGNVLLVGLPGVGKSEVGRLLAGMLGLGFLDLDSWIEIGDGRAVSDVFAQDGEDGFRNLETQAIADLRGIHNHVVALGGGSIENEKNYDIIKNLGVVVWLNCPIPILVHRMVQNFQQLKKRPHFADLLREDGEGSKEELQQRLEALLSEREGNYMSADLVISEGFSTSEDTARYVCQAVSRKGYYKHLWSKTGGRSS